jgi:hypothetical protein
MPRRLLIAALTAAATLLLGSTALATPQLVQDADEPNLPADVDIESVSIHEPPVVGTTMVTHTIRFRGPYRKEPCMYIRTSRLYKLYNGVLHGPNAQPVIVGRTPAAAPDTITYTFRTSVIGSPASYQWRVTSCSGSGSTDLAPDSGYEIHYVGAPLPGPAFP